MVTVRSQVRNAPTSPVVPETGDLADDDAEDLLREVLGVTGRDARAGRQEPIRGV